MAVVITLEDDISVSRGDIFCRPNNRPSVAHDLEATVCWMDERSSLTEGRLPAKHSTRTVRATVQSRCSTGSTSTALHRDEAAAELPLNEIGRVTFHCTEPLLVDDYTTNRTTGSFIIIDPLTNATVGAGVIRVIAATHASPNVVRHGGRLTWADRAAALGSGATLLFTGLSGAGKSTLAAGVEEAVVRSGRPAYLLDGDNLRHGLNGDLGFSDRDRNENVRRAGEVARMFAEAGTLALIALDLPVRRGPPAHPRPPRGGGPALRRDLRQHVARGVRAARPQRPLRPGARGPAPRLHRHRLDLRGASRPRPGARLRTRARSPSRSPVSSRCSRRSAASRARGHGRYLAAHPSRDSPLAPRPPGGGAARSGKPDHRREPGRSAKQGRARSKKPRQRAAPRRTCSRGAVAARRRPTAGGVPQVDVGRGRSRGVRRRRRRHTGTRNRAAGLPDGRACCPGTQAGRTSAVPARAGGTPPSFGDTPRTQGPRPAQRPGSRVNGRGHRVEAIATRLAARRLANGRRNWVAAAHGVVPDQPVGAKPRPAHDRGVLATGATPIRRRPDFQGPPGARPRREYDAAGRAGPARVVGPHPSEARAPAASDQVGRARRGRPADRRSGCGTFALRRIAEHEPRHERQSQRTIGTSQVTGGTVTSGATTGAAWQAHTLLRIPAASALAEADGSSFVTDDQRNLLVRFNPVTGKVRADAPSGRPARRDAPGRRTTCGSPRW